MIKSVIICGAAQKRYVEIGDHKCIRDFARFDLEKSGKRQRLRKRLLPSRPLPSAHRRAEVVSMVQGKPSEK